MKVLVLTSGGVDSTTALAMMVDKYGSENVVALSVSYGQKHTKELESSEIIARYYNAGVQKANIYHCSENKNQKNASFVPNLSFLYFAIDPRVSNLRWKQQRRLK